MSAGKWTLGPWTFREPNGRGMGYEIRETGAWFGRDTLSAQTLANVQLCAAAPELLEALEGLKTILLEWHEDHPDEIGDNEHNYLDKARALIAKARGEK